MGPSLRDFIEALIEQFLRFDWRVRAAIIAVIATFFLIGARLQ